MQQQTIAGIVISVFFLVFLVLYLSSFRNISKDTLIFLFCILQVVSIFFIFFVPRPEGFFFEVSPNRKKCLEEQVALTGRRSCSCCQKGTVGGYPPYYAEWLEPDGKNELWKRTDNWTTDEQSIPYESQLPPTEYVKQMRKKK